MATLDMQMAVMSDIFIKIWVRRRTRMSPLKLHYLSGLQDEKEIKQDLVHTLLVIHRRKIWFLDYEASLVLNETLHNELKCLTIMDQRVPPMKVVDSSAHPNLTGERVPTDHLERIQAFAVVLAENSVQSPT
jgi:hypothetical protein